MAFTLCTITRVEYVAAVARLMKCPYGCCALFPLWNCKVALMTFVRYVSIRPQSLAARGELPRKRVSLASSRDRKLLEEAVTSYSRDV